MNTNDATPAADRGSECNALLGQASEAVPLVERLRLMSRRGHWPLLGDEAADEIERLRARVLELEAAHEDASGAVLQERERCAKLCEAAVQMLQASGYQQAAASVASVADDIRA